MRRISARMGGPSAASRPSGADGRECRAPATRSSCGRNARRLSRPSTQRGSHAPLPACHCPARRRPRAGGPTLRGHAGRPRDPACRDLRGPARGRAAGLRRLRAFHRAGQCPQRPCGQRHGRYRADLWPPRHRHCAALRGPAGAGFLGHRAGARRGRRLVGADRQRLRQPSQQPRRAADVPQGSARLPHRPGGDRCRPSSCPTPTA